MSRRFSQRPATRKITTTSVVIGALVLVLSALSIGYGVRVALASAGVMGTPGKIIITSCFHGRAPSCTGTFRPDDRTALAVQAAGIFGDYDAGTTVPVQLLDGQAWPTHQPGPPDWLAFVIVGVGIGIIYVTALVGGAFSKAVDPYPSAARRRKRRLARSRSRLRRHHHEHQTDAEHEVAVDASSPPGTKAEG